MDGLGNVQPLCAFGTDAMLLAASFACNAAANPLPANTRTPPGLIFTVTYGATGIYTVTLDPTLSLPDLPAYIEANPQCAVLATDWFDTIVIGEFNRTTRAFVIQAHRGGVAQAPAATAGNRINFSIQFRNSTSR